MNTKAWAPAESGAEYISLEGQAYPPGTLMQNERTGEIMQVAKREPVWRDGGVWLPVRRGIGGTGLHAVLQGDPFFVKDSR